MFSTNYFTFFHQIFYLYFFSWFEPIWPLMNRSKIVDFSLHFVEIFKNFRNSAVCIPLLSQTLRCASHCWVMYFTVCIPLLSHTLRCTSHCWVILYSVHPTAESYFTVCIPQLSHTLQCASHGWVILYGVHPTAESYFTVCIPLLSHTSRCASHYRIKSFNNNKTRRCASHSGVRLVGVRHAVESDPRIAS